MKIGVNRWTMPGEWSLAHCFQAAKNAGFDSIEINIAEKGELNLESTEQDVRGIAKAAGETGITLSSLSTGLGWAFPLTSSDSAIRQKGIEAMRRSLAVAQWLGVDTLLCVPGMVTAEVRDDEAYGRAQDALREVAPEAEQRRVSIGVENVWNKMLQSPMEMARFIDEIDNPWIGAYFDVGNILVYGYPQHWIQILGSRIKKVHVKDFKVVNSYGGSDCNPLNGDVPWKEVRKALESIGYDSFVTAEVKGYPSAPELGLRHIAESLRHVFA